MVGRLDAYCATIGGKPTVCVKPGLSPQRAHFLICHEIAELHLGRIGYRESDVELVADQLAAAILIPRGAYRAALQARGEAWGTIALDFYATETCAALRHGEVTGTPVAVVAPTLVRVRGGAWTWPSTDHEIRRLARRPGPGLRACRLTDDRRRVVLLRHNKPA
jgi:hypothetical protein